VCVPEQQTLTSFAIRHAGNEIGSLLSAWSWRCFADSEAFKSGSVKASDCYMIASTVSSKFIGAMAKIEGFHFQETLTGYVVVNKNRCHCVPAADMPRCRLCHACICVFGGFQVQVDG
jgi:hypothetical protein